jgi:hypothetical protein
MDSNPKPSDRGAIAAAIGLGAIAGAVDVVVGSAQIAPTLIVIFTFLLSLTYPRKALLWALLIGMCVPLANTLAVAMGYGHVRRPESIYVTYLAFVPAFIGAYSAAWLRRFAAKQEQRRREGSGE